MISRASYHSHWPHHHGPQCGSPLLLPLTASRSSPEAPALSCQFTVWVRALPRHLDLQPGPSPGSRPTSQKTVRHLSQDVPAHSRAPALPVGHASPSPGLGATQQTPRLYARNWQPSWARSHFSAPMQSGTRQPTPSSQAHPLLLSHLTAGSFSDPHNSPH